MEKKKKILIVDDLKEFAGLIRVFLSKEFEVVAAYDGSDALRKLDGGFKPDAIITDLIMPGLDGYRLISILKEDNRYQKIPVIVLTGVDKSIANLQLNAEKVSGFVGKHFISSHLFNELIPLLRNVTYYAFAS